MTTATTSTSTSEQFDIRLRIPAELDPMIQKRLRLTDLYKAITESQLTDSKTLLIKKWLRSLKIDFESGQGNIHTQLKYIGLLQSILTDPITNAPLNHPVLGSDGNVYDLLPLTIFRDKIKAPYNERSPLDINNPAKLYIEAHPVVVEAIRWLKLQNSHQYTEDIENAYLRLFPKTLQAESRKEKMERIAREHLASERKKTEERPREQLKINHMQTSSLNSRMQSLMKRFSVAAEKTKHTIESACNTAENHIDKMQERHSEDFAEIKKDQEEIREQYQKHLDFLQDQLALVDSDSRASLQLLQEKITAMLYDFDSLTKHVGAFTNSHELEILAKSYEELFAAFSSSVIKTQAQTTAFQAGVAVLVEEVDVLSARISQAERDESALEQRLQHLEQEIADHKERESSGLLATLAIIGACAFGGWALASLGYTKLAFIPICGGCTYGATLSSGSGSRGNSSADSLKPRERR